MTNKSIFFVLLSVAMLITLSCSKEVSGGSEPLESAEPCTGGLVPVEISAINEGVSKSTIDAGAIKWIPTDCISLFGKAGTNASLALTSSEGGSATFAGTADAEGPWIAAYPYSDDNAVSSGSVVLTIPSAQHIPMGGTVADGALVCTGVTDNLSGGIALKNVPGLLKFTLAIDQGDMNSVTIRSNDGSPLAGKVKVNPATGQIEEVIDGTDCITVTIGGETFMGGNYYVAVIPGEHKGMTISFTRISDARKAENTSSNTLTAVRNGITGIGGFDDYTLEWEYLIDSYEDLKAFAADTENWVVGEDVELRADIDMKSEPWTPLTFTQGGGTFKGNGHKIYNLIVSPESNVQHAGFFGRYYKSVDNIIFGSKDGETWDGVSTITCNYTASSSAYAYAAPITFPKKNVTNVVNFCNVFIPANCGSKSRAGGVCAFIEEDGITITGCTNYGKVETFTTKAGATNTCVGGIAGGLAHNSDIVIEDCENYGDIISHNKYTYGLGGILGEKYSGGSRTSVKNCRNYGEVAQISDGNTQSSRISIGGVVGQFAMAADQVDCVISDCTNYGPVSTTAICSQPHIGGVCGRLVGGSILRSVNEGPVDLEFELAVSFTALAGIVGYVYTGYGENHVKDCINRGKVTGVTYSIGHASKTTPFIGTAAGGVIGICEDAISISGNANYGAVDFITKRKGASTYSAVAYAGGIIAYVSGPIETFSNNHNYPEGSISAAATNASSGSYEDICAGGVVGKLTTATMYVGISESPVRATKAASGHAYAGSIAGMNNSVIATCYFSGTVNGESATTANVVGNGNAPKIAGPVKEVFDYDSSLDDLGSEDAQWD